VKQEALFGRADRVGAGGGTGTPVAELIRKIGVSEQAFYRWKKVYGGLEPS
jgi:hypothetical protein